MNARALYCGLKWWKRRAVILVSVFLVVGTAVLVPYARHSGGHRYGGEPGAAGHSAGPVAKVRVQQGKAIKSSETGRRETEPAIQAIVRATDASEAAQGFQKLFAGAGAGELRRLKCHKQLTIALTAAWEEVRLGFPKRGERWVKVDTQRFLGFVEGRLGVPIPQVWERAVSQTRADNPHLAMVRRPYGATYRSTDLGYSVAPGISLERCRGSLFVKSGSQSVRLSEDVVAQAKKAAATNKIRFHGHISASLTPAATYLAIHILTYLGQDVIVLVRVEPDSGRPLWSAMVWGRGGMGLNFSQPDEYHWVGLVPESERVTVFGVTPDGAYIEGFNAADGRNVFRFNTTYSFSFPVEASATADD